MPLASVAQASALVPDGATIALGGMTLYRRPVALVRDLLRRRPRNLTLAALTGGFEADLLVGAGCVSTCRTCYFGLEIFGPAPMYSTSKVKIVEETETTILGGLRGPIRINVLAGTDVLRERPDIRIVNGVVDFPQIEIDVALIHALEADREGNARFEGNLAADLELACRAKTVIVSAERIVDRVEPMLKAHHVVEAPKGAWPTSCWPDYPFDGLEILNYVRACRAGRFEGYLDAFLSR